MTGMLKTIVWVLSSHHDEYEWDLMEQLLQQIAQIMRATLMALTTIYHAVLNVLLICFH